MKSFFIALALGLSLFSANTFAGNDVTCRSSDRGWEEHSNGHPTCGECLQRHGRCIESCSIEYVTCEVTGRDYAGTSITLQVSGSDRYEAERAALNFCQRSFNNCSISNCSTSSDTVSRKECIRPPAPETPPKLSSQADKP
ncbi:MAG: hypothetical protein ACM3MG_08495 [Bacillota bacterium]